MMKKGNVLFAIVMVLVTVGIIYSFVLFVRENNVLLCYYGTYV